MSTASSFGFSSPDRRNDKTQDQPTPPDGDSAIPDLLRALQHAPIASIPPGSAPATDCRPFGSVWDLKSGAVSHLPPVSLATAHVVRAIIHHTRRGSIAPTEGAIALIGELRSLYGAATVEDHIIDRLPEWVAEANRNDEPHVVEGNGYRICLRGFADRASAEKWARIQLAEDSPSDDEAQKTQLVSGHVAELEHARELKDWFDSLPQDYEARHRELLAAHQLFRTLMANSLAPSLNRYIDEHQPNDFESKKKLAKWINGQLKKLGLSVRSEKGPGILIASAGNDPEVGRFQVEYVNEAGIRRRTMTALELPALQLAPTPLEFGPSAEQSKDR